MCLGIFGLSVRSGDIPKAASAQIWRRTAAMASVKVRLVLRYSLGRSHDERLRPMKIVGPDGNEGVQTEQHRCRPGDGAIGPLPLCLDAKVTTDFGEGDLDSPASDEPGQDVFGAGV